MKIKAIVFDWAGTVIDYGCFAPIHAFLHAFKSAGMEVTMDEVRKPMGLLKRDHIAAILNMERVRKEWKEKYNRLPNEQDVDSLYQSFEQNLFTSLDAFTDPLPGVIEVVNKLRKEGKKIGSTTGYTREMIDIVAANAKQKGYVPDYISCADEVKNARPAPDMIFQNMVVFDIFQPRSIIKVGDTISDIKEGKNAGVWTVSIIKGSSELGLTEEEVDRMDPNTLEKVMNQVKERFQAAGADFVVESIHELPSLVGEIEQVLEEDVDHGTLL